MLLFAILKSTESYVPANDEYADAMEINYKILNVFDVKKGHVIDMHHTFDLMTSSKLSQLSVSANLGNSMPYPNQESYFNSVFFFFIKGRYGAESKLLCIYSLVKSGKLSQLTLYAYIVLLNQESYLNSVSFSFQRKIS